MAAVEGMYLWHVIIDVGERIEFKAYPPPYQARIVGFDVQRGAKSASYAPIVEVELPRREKFCFRSRHYNARFIFDRGEAVELVHRPKPTPEGKPDEEFEINNAWHLWLGDVGMALFFPAIFISAHLAPRFRDNARPKLRLWPIRRLQRQRK